MKKKIGCEGEDARFIACSGCLFEYDSERCKQTKDDGNMKYVIKWV